jgi:2-polyprenyl-6-methoxyphenol hydroxylase-like FAD-dependent oxidoreductase
MTSVDRILIVGGGLAGLALATALRRQGFAPELVERSGTWASVGAGILLHANGVRVLRSLDLEAAALRAGTVIRRQTYYDPHGVQMSEIDLEQLWGEVGPCVGIARPVLHRVLLAGAAGVRTRLGTAVTSVAEKDHEVQVGFGDGSSATYDLVVGADGIRSTVRQLVWNATSVGYSGVMCWRGLVPMRPAGVTGWTGLLGDGRIFGLVPMGDGYTYGFAYAGGPFVHDPLEGRLARVRERFAGFGGPVPEFLAALARDEDLHCAPIEWVEPVTSHRGRIVLIGDAAHAGPPSMAEGGCMALEDAWVLAEALRVGSSVEEALATHDARRRPRVAWVAQQSRSQATTFRERANEAARELYGPLIAAP